MNKVSTTEQILNICNEVLDINSEHDFSTYINMLHEDIIEQVEERANEGDDPYETYDDLVWEYADNSEHVIYTTKAFHLFILLKHTEYFEYGYDLFRELYHENLPTEFDETITKAMYCTIVSALQNIEGLHDVLDNIEDGTDHDETDED